jgi:hypothetical protein
VSLSNGEISKGLGLFLLGAFGSGVLGVRFAFSSELFATGPESELLAGFTSLGGLRKSESSKPEVLEGTPATKPREEAKETTSDWSVARSSLVLEEALGVLDFPMVALAHSERGGEGLGFGGTLASRNRPGGGIWIWRVGSPNIIGAKSDQLIT